MKGLWARRRAVRRICGACITCVVLVAVVLGTSTVGLDRYEPTTAHITELDEAYLPFVDRTRELAQRFEMDQIAELVDRPAKGRTT